MTMTRTQKESALNVLMLIASADDDFDVREALAMHGYIAGTDISEQEVEDWQPSDDWPSSLPTDKREQLKLMSSAIMLMLADGHVHHREMFLCTKLALSMGMPPLVVPAVIAAIMSSDNPLEGAIKTLATFEAMGLT